MAASPGEGVEVERQTGNEGLALAGTHFGDLPAVKRDATHQLHVVVAHAKGASGGLTDGGERFREDVVEGLVAGRGVYRGDVPVGVVEDETELIDGNAEPAAELECLGAQGLVVERLIGGFEGVDLVDDRLVSPWVTVTPAGEEPSQPLDHRTAPARPVGWRVGSPLPRNGRRAGPRPPRRRVTCEV